MQAHKRSSLGSAAGSVSLMYGRGAGAALMRGSDDFDADGFDGPLDHPARDAAAHFARSEGGCGVVGRPPLSTDCPV
jgi:hypothetical protein